MSRHKYKQVQLRLYNEDVDSDGQLWYTSMVAYIPEHFAKVGNKILVEDKKWKVHWAGRWSIDEEDLPDHQKIIRAHRKNTGDSLPKGEQWEK